MRTITIIRTTAARTIGVLVGIGVVIWGYRMAVEYLIRREYRGLEREVAPDEEGEN